MQVRTRHLTLVESLKFLVVVATVTGCLGSAGIDPTEDPVQPTNEASSDENGNNSASSNEDEKNLNAEQNSVGSQANATDQNPENSKEENFLDSKGGENLLGDSQANNNLGLNNQGDAESSLANNTELDAPVNSSSTSDDQKNKTNTTNPPDELAKNPSMEKDSVIISEQSQQQALPKTGDLVRYVVTDGSKMHSKPNGDAVRDLEQGDHPLVNQQGEWSKTSDGYFIPTQSLTDAAIPRNKRVKQWQ